MYRFTHAIVRAPGGSVVRGLRSSGAGDPDPAAFLAQHRDYVAALEDAGLDVTVLPALEDFPDSVFVEDAALCLPGTAITLKPGAPTRAGETAALRPILGKRFDSVIELPGDGTVDGGDVLFAGEEAFIGLSARTDEEGCAALSSVLADLGYRVRRVASPPGVLHLKSDCGLLDSETIFATRRLAASGCFSGYRVIEAPGGEEAAANLVRVNDVVLLRSGFPRARTLLEAAGFALKILDADQAALVDGGLSCMSLRFAR
ncbi:MAG: dimethylarginine dimethylaminohydrolase [Gammaproteobacteria bacterium]|nr:dimethylarginine dimethylaminohydrolase [Gammaproteobacteria bacterium]